MGDATSLVTPDFTAEVLFGPEHKRNPHPLYHELRRVAPLFRNPEFDELILTRWADCEAVLRDPNLA